MNNDWDVFYTGCYNDDGSLFFPERLTTEFLENAKRRMGTQFFANQYLNVVIDEEAKPFKQRWLRYYLDIPKIVNRFAFIDPAISQADSADFTAIVIVAVDPEGMWYLEHASRHKLTPSGIVDLVFHIYDRYKPKKIGIEDVAFQKALVFMCFEEMHRRNVFLPVEGIKPPTDKTKHLKILGLIPRFEWERIFINKGLHDFEQEYLDYAGERSKHDDLLDALSSTEVLITYPSFEQETVQKPNSAAHPDYERWYREQLTLGKRPGREHGY